MLQVLKTKMIPAENFALASAVVQLNRVKVETSEKVHRIYFVHPAYVSWHTGGKCYPLVQGTALRETQCPIVRAIQSSNVLYVCVNISLNGYPNRRVIELQITLLNRGSLCNTGNMICSI